jgi:virginiamycin A acetyltransferase
VLLFSWRQSGSVFRRTGALLALVKAVLYPIYIAIKKICRAFVWKKNCVYIAPGSWVAVDTTIDKFTRINHASHLGSCTVGRFVACGGRLIVRTSDHYTCYANMQDWAQHKIIRSELQVAGKTKGRVHIRSASWIGDSVIILPGGSVGFGAVVGAGSIVTKPVPDFAVAVGCPARVIKYRFPSHCIQFLLEIQWWDWSPEKIRKNKFFFEIDFSKVLSCDLPGILSSIQE